MIGNLLAGNSAMGRSAVLRAVCVALALSSFAAGAFAQTGGRPDSVIKAHEAELLHDQRTQSLGSVHGDVTIVEFFDYTCPFCKAAEPRIEALLKADKGVRLVVKEYPILSPQSPIASRAALAAARQGRYTAYHQAMLLHRGELDESAIFSIAHDVGLDVVRLRRDMNDPVFAREIDDNMKLAKAIGVHGTPTFIVDDQIVTQPSATLDFAQLVAASRQAHHRG
jgi:protein-disulfide isomerase